MRKLWMFYFWGACSFCVGRISGTWPGNPAVDVQNRVEMLVVSSGCPATWARCPGPQVWPDVRASARCLGPVTCFSAYMCAHFTAPGCPVPGPDVRPGTATYTPTAIFALPLYISLYPSGRGLTTSSQIAPRTQVAPSHCSDTKS